MEDRKGTIAVLSSHTPSLFWFRIEMMKEFQRKGWKVYAVGNEPELYWHERFNEIGIPYRQIKVKRNGTNPISDIGTLMSVIKLLKELRPDKIFTYQAKTVIYGGIAARILGIEEVYPLIAGVGSVFLSEKIKARILRSVLIAEYKLALKNSKCVFFQNTDDMSVFRQYGMIDCDHSVRMIPGSGVNTARFVPTTLPDIFGFLCVSRLIRDKGIFEYLEACRFVKKKNPKVRCMLVGPYDTNPTSLQPEDIQPYIDDGTIEYYGEQADVKPYYEKCSVYVLPSYREGMPKTVLEAMACGRAVITTDTPGCRETVKEGKNGLIVPAKDIHILAEKMEYMYDHQEEVKTMGSYGRSIAEMQFDVGRVNSMVCEAMGV